MNILHIHQDYPDGRARPPTKAVQNLIKASKEYDKSVDHYVLSINRTSNPFKVSVKAFDEGLSIVYWAIPLPYIYVPMIWFCSIYMAFFLRKQKFTLIHGHKLTTEGIFTYFFSKKFNIPYVLSVRGGSDIHNIKRLKLIVFFKKIYNHASLIFWVSVWAKKHVRLLLNVKIEENNALPNICEINLNNKVSSTSRNKYVIILSYHQLRRKGLLPLLEAIKELNNQGNILYLDVIGSGDKITTQLIKNSIQSLELGEQVKLLGQLPLNEVLEHLKKSKGLILPAINETFGMAYVEALSCGSPVLYVSDTGIDGHIDDYLLGVKVEGHNVESLKLALLKLEGNYSQYQKALSQIIENKYLVKFTGPFIAQKYVEQVLTVKYIEN